MIQIQSIIDQVRMAIQNDRYEETPELLQLVDEYRETITKINDRLRRCGDFLRNGLRSEAIQEAESEPKLLDAVAIFINLTEEEVTSWRDLIEFLNLPPVPTLLPDIPDMLGEAYNDYAPHEKLLRLFRKVNLQRAPLQTRLSLLRKIHQEDSNTEHWEEDILKYEQVRLNEITFELQQMKRKPNLEILNQLKQEINNSSWKTKIPKKLTELVGELQLRIQHQEAYSELTQLEQKLTQAHSEMNYEKAKDHLLRWQEVLPLAGINEEDPLLIQAEPAIQWCLDQMDQEEKQIAFDKYLSRLDSYLSERNIELEELQRLHDEAFRHQLEMPEKLKQRLDSKLNSLRNYKQKRFLMIVTGSVLGVLIVSGVIWISIQNALDNSKRAGLITQVSELITTGEYASARKQFEEYDPQYQNFPDWTQLKTELETAENNFKQRQANIESELVQAAGAGAFDDVNFERHLAEATALGNQTPVIKDLQQLIESRISNLKVDRVKLKSMKENDVNKRLVAISQTVKELSNRLETISEKELLNISGQTQDALSLILTDAQGMSPDIIQSIDFQMKNLSTLRKEHNRHINRLASVEKLREASHFKIDANASRNFSQYCELLKKHIEDFPEDKLSTGGKLFLSQKNIWLAIMQKQIEFSEVQDLIPSSSNSIDNRLKQIDRVLTLHTDNPSLKCVVDYKNKLTVYKQRFVSLSKLKSELEKDAWTKLFVVTRSDTKLPYYIRNGTSLKNGSSTVYNFDAFTAVIGKREETVHVTSSELTTSEPVTAPQKSLSEKLTTTVNDMNSMKVSWEAGFLSLAKMLIETEQVDSILRVHFLDMLMDEVSKGSFALSNSSEFQQIAKKIKSEKSAVNYTDWADPKDKEIKNKRELAKQFLNESLANQIEKVLISDEVNWSTIEKDFRIKYEFIGFVNEDKNHKMIADVNLPTSGNWKLTVPSPSKTGSSTSTNSVIGFIANGNLNINDSNINQLNPGLLIFSEQN